MFLSFFRNRIRLLIICIIFFSIGFYVYIFYINKPRFNNSSFPDQKVTVILAKQKVFPLVVNSQGIVKSRKNIMLTTKAKGTIKKIYVEPGQHVNKGDLLVQIDDFQELAAIQQSQQQLNTALKNYTRNKKLANAGMLSASELEGFYDTVAQERSELAKAKRLLKNRKIVAPFEGEVGIIANSPNNNNNNETILTEGSYVNENSDIISISNNQDQFIEYFIPQKYRKYLFIGQKVTIETPNGKKIYSKVSYISPNISSDTNSYTLRAPIPKQDNENFVTGMYVNLEQLLNQNYKTYYIPALSLVTALTGNYVYVVEKNKIVQKPITIKSQFGKFILIKSGIKKGDLIVTSSVDAVSNGQKVNIVTKTSGE